MKMVELGFSEQKKKPMRLSSGGSRDDDSSPTSIIFTNESNFSLFSSANGSVDRSSFASDQVYDHDSLVSELSKHLAGSDPDLAHNISTVQEIDFPLYTDENAKVLEEEGEREDCVTLDPGKCSFSQALRECQYRRFTLEALPAQKRPERHRPVSLDLNNPGSNVTCSPPRLGGMRKSSGSSRKLDTFPSPGTPNYWRSNVGSQKGWSSERVPLPTNGGRRYVTAGVLPFNPGRTLPSKWEDAEKWIFSPFAGDGVSRSSKPPAPHRRPKSKSGPIGQPEIEYASAYSPSIPRFEGRNIENYMGRSPFSAGVLAIDSLPNQHPCSDGNSSNDDGSIGGGASYPVNGDSGMVRSASIHGCSSSLLSQSSLSGFRERSKDVVTMSSQTTSRRDVATQMSPDGSTHSSPKRTSFSHSPPSILPIVEMQNHHSKLEVRDVEVDDRVTVKRWSRKHGTRVARKGSDVKDRKKRASETRASTWEIAETGISKSKREEAKITAWENLQKAKAETAIRKLEMKLEKKRSSSMDKIMDKFRSAQKKAQEMRNSTSSDQTRQVARTSGKAISFRKHASIGVLGGCFTCHAC